MVNIFLDDLRIPPDGFLHATSFDSCQRLLLEHQGNIDILSLDNNLGKASPRGSHLAVWMTTSKIIFPRRIYIHTASYAERAVIKAILDGYIEKLELPCEVYDHPYSP